MLTPNDKTVPESADSGNSGNQGKNLPDGTLENIAAGAQDVDFLSPDPDAMRKSVEADLKKLDEELLRVPKKYER